jgi:hypothetical protein
MKYKFYLFFYIILYTRARAHTHTLFLSLSLSLPLPLPYSLHRSCHCWKHLPDFGPLEPNFRVGNSQKSLRARSGEYGGWVMTGMFFSARDGCTTSDVWLGALSWCRNHCPCLPLVAPLPLQNFLFQLCNGHSSIRLNQVFHLLNHFFGCGCRSPPTVPVILQHVLSIRKLRYHHHLAAGPIASLKQNFPICTWTSCLRAVRTVTLCSMTNTHV